jgi:hypothetical protein
MKTPCPNSVLSRTRIAIASTLFIAAAVALANGLPDTRVNVGSPTTPFSQNKQNEPAIAVDANHPTVLVAGANDNIDMEACNAGPDTDCPFTPGVGSSGVYFSFDSGATWVQPMYTGWSARACTGSVGPDAGCTPDPSGPIGTLPWYYENGLVSNGDPAVAFGPKPDANGQFSWANGSRLYYANLATNSSTVQNEISFKGLVAVAVSRTDDVATAATGGTAGKSAWMPPVIVTKQNGALFSDKEQIWADNAASSPFFGNVYVTNTAFRGAVSSGFSNQPIMVSVSSDGGNTWTTKKVTSAATNLPHGYKTGCTIRTDSSGVVYLFYTNFAFGSPGIGNHGMVKSYDGGKSWTKPTNILRMNDACYNIDPIQGSCVEDGIAGARSDLSASPNIDIANGAPTGTDATNEIVDVWADGRYSVANVSSNGFNHEKVLLSYSTNGGTSWSSPTQIQTPGDRGFYAAPAISPNGTDLYVVYNAFTTSYRNDTTSARSLVGVVKHADIGAGGAPINWSELHRGASGDPRASSANSLVAEFLGDYVYAVATRTYGAGVWNDVRNAADCPAIDTYRQALQNGTSPTPPAPEQDCLATFGNSDIYGISLADPTP